jgi:cysteine-rich repeat protein
VGVLALPLGGCGGSASTGLPDGGGNGDSGVKPTADTGTTDANSHDAALHDAALRDTGTTDAPATTRDTGLSDVSPPVLDAPPPDAFMPDASIPQVDAGSLCGNGMIDPGEQCDDGNHDDLDGCDSHCRYEMITRMTSISISSSAGPAFCVHGENALGTKAITTLALGQLNPPLQTDVTNGTVNVFTQFFSLSSLEGVSSTSFEIGVLDGTLDPAKGTWPTSGNPVDWWFSADPTAVSNGIPTGILGGGALANGALSAGPSTVNVDLTLGGSAAALTMRDAKIVADIPTTPAPNTPAPPPTAVAAGLVTFQTLVATGTGQGLCGDITVQSLAQIPVPSALTTGTTKCSQGYTYCGASMPVGASCNSLLDVLVGGCSIGGFITAVNATQPDVPPSGSTTVQALTAGTGHKVTVPAAAGTEAYSAYLQFAANRAHFTAESCTATTTCQTGQSCTSGVCK